MSSSFDFSAGGSLGTVSASPSFASSFVPPTTTPSTSGGLFGQVPTTPASTPLFGGGATPSLFGTGPSLFGGGTTAATTTPSLFGTTSSATPTLLWNGAIPAAGGGVVAATTASDTGYRGQPQEAMHAYACCWAKETTTCRFIHAFYNQVPPGDVPKYTRPQDVDERSWAQAIQHNPDPHRMVPIFAKSFDDLKKRLTYQDDAIKDQQEQVRNAIKRINNIQHQRQATMHSRIEDAKRINVALASRVLRVMRKVETLRAMGIPSMPEEEAFRDKLQLLRRELNQPTTFKPKLNELSSYLLMQDEMQDVQYEALDEESMKKIFQVLKQQQEGLTRLTEILTQDLQAIHFMLTSGGPV